jgi:hypothetical protein
MPNLSSQHPSSKARKRITHSHTTVSRRKKLEDFLNKPKPFEWQLLLAANAKTRLVEKAHHIHHTLLHPSP